MKYFNLIFLMGVFIMCGCNGSSGDSSCGCKCDGDGCVCKCADGCVCGEGQCDGCHNCE